MNGIDHQGFPAPASTIQSLTRSECYSSETTGNARQCHFVSCSSSGNDEIHSEYSFCDIQEEL